jgi:hypothetical protein
MLCQEVQAAAVLSKAPAPLQPPCCCSFSFIDVNFAYGSFPPTQPPGLLLCHAQASVSPLAVTLAASSVPLPALLNSAAAASAANCQTLHQNPSCKLPHLMTFRLPLFYALCAGIRQPACGDASCWQCCDDRSAEASDAAAAASEARSSHQLCTICQGYVVLKASSARVEFSTTHTWDAFQHNIILANGARLAAGSVALPAVVKFHLLLLHHFFKRFTIIPPANLLI